MAHETTLVFACYQAFRITDSKNVYTDNHSGISARHRDSKVSMTDLVSADDDVNLRVSTGLSAAIDESRRRRR